MIIKKEEPSVVNESLGIQFFLTGNQSKQKEVLKKSERFCSTDKRKKCNKTTALWTFTNSFFPSMMYPIVATHFTETEWLDIIRPIVRATLSSAETTKKFQGAFFGPENFQGLDVYHPYFLQEIIHIQILFQESSRNSQTWRLLKANAKSFGIEIDVPFSISDTPYDKKTFAYYSSWMEQINAEVCFKR